MSCLKRVLHRTARAIICAIAASLTAGSPLAAQPVTAPGKPVLELRGGRWFDGHGFKPANWFVVDGRFTATRPVRVDAVVDLGEKYVLPPLADAHNHNLQSAYTAAMFAPRLLKQGVFYSAQLGSNPAEIMPFAGLLSGPGAIDVLFADTLISASDGHPLRLALDGAKQAGMTMTPEDVRDKLYTSVDTLADLDAKWPAIAQGNPKLIKAVLIDSARYTERHGVAEHFGVNGLDPALLPEIVSRAHAAGARVAVHIDTAHDAAVAVASGADIVAHLPGYRFDPPLSPADYRLSDSTIAEAARRKITWITTIAAARYYLASHEDQRVALMANHADNLRRLRKAGVMVAIGSDVFDGTPLDEIAALDALGVIPRTDLIDIATRATPRAIFPDRAIGCLCEGAEASLIALEVNPLTDLNALGRIDLAIKQGELLAR